MTHRNFKTESRAGPGPRIAAHRESHSWHVWRGPHIHDGSDRTKPDRLLVAILAGAALFYLFGQAMGLGRQ